MIKVVIVGDKEVRKKFNQLSIHGREIIRDGLEKAAIAVESRAKRNVYGHHPEKLVGDTGRLRQSITHNVKGLEAEIGTNVIYARIHEYGGIIRPVRALWLVFRPRFFRQTSRMVRERRRSYSRRTMCNRLVFARRVQIPPRPYLEPSLREVAPRFSDIFTQEFRRATQ